MYGLYSHFKAASGFMTASALAGQNGLVGMSLPVRTSQKSDLRFGPGGGFVAASQNEFVVGEAGAPPGMDKFPAFLQGQAHRDLIPKPLMFQVSYAQPGKFSVRVGQISKSGGHLKLSVDGKEGVKGGDRDFAGSINDHEAAATEAVVQIDIPAGAHTITIENSGRDWLTVREFAFSDYAPALAARARMGKEYVGAWIYNRGQWDASKDANLTPASGRILLTGLQPGRYRATWWDTHEGRNIDTSDLTVTKDKESATVATPPITRDVALFVTKATTPTEKVARSKKSSKGPASIYAPAASGAATGLANDARPTGPGTGASSTAGTSPANGAPSSTTKPDKSP